MAVQTINNGELLNVVRTKVNQNFTEMEITGNKTQAISSTPSTTKYPSEKAVFDFASKTYLSSSVPTSKSGDLILHTNAPVQAGGVKGKLKYNANGTLSEFVPDRSVVDCRHSSVFSSANPVLLAGELAVESDTLKQKIGNGSTPYNSLSYLIGASESGASELITGGSETAGWVKFPNNMLFQWGVNVIQTDGYGRMDKLVTLPTTITHAHIYSHGYLSTEVDWMDSRLLVHTRFFNNNTLRFVCDSTVDGVLGMNAYYDLCWISIGF